MKRLAIALALSAICSTASAGVKSTVTATNGVPIDVYSDSFADRYEYTAPSIQFSEDGSSNTSSFALVAAVKKGGVRGNINIVGTIYYSGEWHYYEQAIYKGGASAKFTNTGRSVLSCRYGCSYTEGFSLDVTPAEIAKYSANGILQIQFRSKNATTALLSVPVTYFAAVEEVSK